MRLPPEWLEKFYTFAYFGTLGAFAALVGYLVQLSAREGKPISLLALAVACFAGFYLGMLFGVMGPQEWENRDALVLLIGATGVKGFELASRAAREVIPDIIKRVFGGGPPSPPSS